MPIFHRTGVLTVLFTAILLLSATMGAAEPYVDISVGWAEFYFWNTSARQTFVPNVDNIMPSAYVEIRDLETDALLNQGSGFSTQSFNWAHCELAGAEPVVPGRTYVIVVESDFLIAVGAFGYTDGEAWSDHPQEDFSYLGDLDLIFRTWADTDPIPAADKTWSAVKALYR